MRPAATSSPTTGSAAATASRAETASSAGAPPRPATPLPAVRAPKKAPGLGGSGRGLIGRLGLGVLVLAVLVGIAYGVSSLLTGDASGAASGAALFTVRRAPLRVSVVEKGNLKAVESQDIECEIEGQSTILKIVPEGDRVKAGDVVCVLDASALEEKKAQQDITVAKAEADFIAARETYEIQKNQNASDIADAALKAEFARMDQMKYDRGDRLQDKQEAETKIKLAEQDLARSKDKLDWSLKLEQKGYISRLELEGDRLALTKAELDLSIATTALEVLVNAEYGTEAKQKLELGRKLDEAVAEVDRVKHKADAGDAQANANLKAKEATFNLEKQRLDKLTDQISKGVIKAPADGLVVYATTSEGRFGSDQRPIEEGANVRQHQLILSLPDVSRMKAVAKIHESVFEKVSPGQPVVLSVDAFGAKSWGGEVTKVAVIPDSQSSWLNPDLKVYSTEILMDGDTRELRPGMSCSCEIVVADAPAAIQVPIQAIHRRKSKHVAFVRRDDGTGEERAVTIGLHSESRVEIKEGLAEGEVVYLTPPNELLEGIDRETGLEGDVGGRPLMPGQSTERLPGESRRRGENAGDAETRTAPGGGDRPFGGLDPGSMPRGSDFFERMKKGELTDAEKAHASEMMKGRRPGGDSQRDGGEPGAGRRRDRGDGQGGGGRDGGSRHAASGESSGGSRDASPAAGPPAPSPGKK